jgi:hypothetical protein
MYLAQVIKTKATPAKAAASKHTAVTLIDSKRAYNIGILMNGGHSKRAYNIGILMNGEHRLFFMSQVFKQGIGA